MKAALALGLLLILEVPASASYAPYAPPRAAPSPDDSSMFVGPAGAMLESDYFRAPRSLADRRVFPCRLELSVFDKTRLAQNCN